MRVAASVVCGALSLLAFGVGFLPGTVQAGAVASVQGFRPRPGGSEVFVVLHGRPGEPTVQKTPGGIQLLLPKTRMKRPFRSLETRYFATPVKLVSALRRQRDLVIDVALKDEAVKANVAPKLDVRKKGGVLTIALSFPPGEPDKTPPPLPRGKLKGDGGETSGDDGESALEACRRKCGAMLSQDAPDEVGHEKCNKKCAADHPQRASTKTISTGEP